MNEMLTFADPIFSRGLESVASCEGPVVASVLVELARRYAPPSLLMDGSARVLHGFASMGQLVEIAGVLGDSRLESWLTAPVAATVRQVLAEVRASGTSRSRLAGPIASRARGSVMAVVRVSPIDMVDDTYMLCIEEQASPAPGERWSVQSRPALDCFADDRGGLAVGCAAQRVQARAAQSLEALSIFEHAAHAMLVLSMSGQVLLANGAAERLFKRTQRQLQGVGHEQLLAPDWYGHRARRRLLRSLQRGGAFRGEMQVVDGEGRTVPLWLTVDAVRDGSGQIERWVAVAGDIGPLKSNVGRLEQMAFYDPVTGLPNRRLFLEHAKAALLRARRQRTMMAVCFFDLDRFKAVNDRLGHDVGDLLLRQVSERLAGGLRSSDLLARLGGDEFTVVLEEVQTEQDAAHVGQKLVELLSEPYEILGHRLRCSASMGVATYPLCGEDALAVTRCADVAMYHAKRAGGGQALHYRRGMEMPDTAQ